MADRYESVSDVQLGIEFLECTVVNLPIVVDDDGVEKSKSINN